MRKISAAIVCLLVCTPAAVQADSGDPRMIRGRLRFNPPTASNVDVALPLFHDGRQVQEIRVQGEPPYRFSEEIPAGLTGDELELRVIVNRPSEYVPIVAEYTKPADRMLYIREITLKKKDSAYLEAIQYATRYKASDPESALKRLEAAMGWATDEIQKLEIIRLQARIFGEVRGDWLRHQQVLRNAQELTFAEIGPKKTRVYFEERLDGFLELAEYLTMRQPEVDFGVFVAEGDESRRALWRQLVQDFNEEYRLDLDVEGELMAERITAQLRVMKRSLGRR